MYGLTVLIWKGSSIRCMHTGLRDGGVIDMMYGFTTLI